MKSISIALFLACLINLSFTARHEPKGMTINWVDELDGDFSFKNKWSYPEGVYRNRFGQLSCDGFCPIETDQMKDSTGRIYPDSLEAFYQVVDTAHVFHSVQCEAWTYEWAGTNFMTFKRAMDGVVIGNTMCNAATHSSLNMILKRDGMNVWIDYNSVRNIERKQFFVKRGKVTLDKTKYAEGIIKGEFDLTFVNTLDSTRKMYWNGRIYSKIEE